VSRPIADFFGDEARQLLGAKVFTEPYSELAAGAIDMNLRRKRLALGWGQVEPAPGDVPFYTRQMAGAEARRISLYTPPLT
jgi:hypothetical protein